MFGNLGVIEVVIIATVVLIFFGKQKLNDLAKGLGESTKEFKKISRDLNSPIESVKKKTTKDDSESGDAKGGGE